LIGNIWNFTADQVPDFAFGLSNHYLWDATSLLLNANKNRRVNIFTAYPPEAIEFKEVIIHSRDAIKFFSEKEPGIPFPYDKLLKPYITSHEIFHNYFPFYTGINERICTWMDEGLANLYHYKYLISIYPNLNPSWLIDEFETYSGTISDFPIFTTSMALLDDDLYFNHSTKSHIAYLILEKTIGKDKFRTGIQEFTNRWKGKHPSALDFFLTLNESTGEDLNWFWKPWFFEFGYPDLSIDKVENANVTILRKGNLPVPIVLEIIYEDSSQEIVSRPANVWSSGDIKYKIKIENNKKIREIVLNKRGNLIPDKFRKDNFYQSENDR